MMTETPKCPRCGHFIPNDEMPGQYPGAISRVDNDTEVCSWCGQHEAMEQFFDKDLTPMADWLVNQPTDVPVDDYRLVLLGRGRQGDQVTLGLDRADHEFRKQLAEGKLQVEGEA